MSANWLLGAVGQTTAAPVGTDLFGKVANGGGLKMISDGAPYRTSLLNARKIEARPEREVGGPETSPRPDARCSTGRAALATWTNRTTYRPRAMHGRGGRSRV